MKDKYVYTRTLCSNCHNIALAHLGSTQRCIFNAGTVYTNHEWYIDLYLGPEDREYVQAKRKDGRDYV